MKTSALASFSFVVLLGTAAAGAAQTGARPVSTPPPTPPAAASAPAPAPPRPAAPATTTATAAANDYRLVNGDKLRVEVYKDPQLSQSLQIRPDGKITLPLVGDVPAAGRTSSELRDSIAASLKEYMGNPVVTVIVVETMPQTIYVMGEVQSPGPQSVRGEISILQAIATAGGFKDFAKKKSIKILRPGPKGTTTLSFNYNDAVKGDAKVINLQPGDTVIVP
jgi:polysaccharide export outer membrane protein